MERENADKDNLTKIVNGNSGENFKKLTTSQTGTTTTTIIHSGKTSQNSLATESSSRREKSESSRNDHRDKHGKNFVIHYVDWMS